MAAYSARVYGARVIVTSLYDRLQGQSLWCKGIVTSLYGSLHGQSLWCKGNCNEFVWQLTGTVYGVRASVTILCGSLQGQS